MNDNYHCGLIALIGRPNVGKSTLMNRLIGKKISITSRRPQTTRHRITGIKTTEDAQFVYVDTPGLQQQVNKAMNRMMDKAARSSLIGIDCVIFVITEKGWRPGDEFVLQLVRNMKIPVILVINKIDRLGQREQLLPLIEQSRQKMDFAEIVPLSARNGENIDQLESAMIEYLPEQPPLYPQGQTTDRSERFIAAELLREQVFRAIGQEVPYAVSSAIEGFEPDDKGILHIDGVIWVEKEGQKAIIIGKQGQRLKDIGRSAREEMERLFARKVYLQLWVKVKKGWSNSEQALRQLGYEFED